MKVIAICNKHIRNTFRDIEVKELLLDGENISIALLKVQDVDHKKYFQPNSVLVRIKAFSCNFRDRVIMHYFNQKCKVLSGSGKYFYSPIGSDFVGEVVDVGSAVTVFKIGDRVIPDAAYPVRNDGFIGGVPSNYASQELNIFRENQLIKVPDNMPDEVAASFTIAAQTTYSMVRKLELKDGANVLVTAATSNTSLAVLSILKNCPVNIYAVSSKGEAVVEKINSISNNVIVIPLSEIIDGSIVENIGPIRLDAVIDPFADLYFDKLLPILNFNAKYIFCGLYRQHESYSTVEAEKQRFSFQALLSHCITLNISFIANCLGQREDLEKAIKDYSNGKFDIPIDSIFTENDFLEFFNRGFSTEKLGKVVLKYQ